VSMRNHYTTEDLTLLVHLFRHESIGAGIFFYKRDIEVKKWYLKTDEVLYRALRAQADRGHYGRIGRPPFNKNLVWTKYYDKARWLMFTASLEKMPLYINDAEPLRVIAAWRLRLAR